MHPALTRRAAGWSRACAAGLPAGHRRADVAQLTAADRGRGAGAGHRGRRGAGPARRTRAGQRRHAGPAAAAGALRARHEPTCRPGLRLGVAPASACAAREGATPWNVYLPVTVQVLAPALVAAPALPAGSRLDADPAGQAEVDWAARRDAAVHGRSRRCRAACWPAPWRPAQALRPTDLQPRRWFAPGDTVRISARGAASPSAPRARRLTPGREGQPARVRTDSGRVVVGRPVGERRVELAL